MVSAEYMSNFVGKRVEVVSKRHSNGDADIGTLEKNGRFYLRLPGEGLIGLYLEDIVIVNIHENGDRNNKKISVAEATKKYPV